MRPQVIKLLKSKEASNAVDVKSWPPTLDTDDLRKGKLPGVYRWVLLFLFHLLIFFERLFHF